MLVHGKAVAVVLVEPIAGAKPHEAIAILEDAVDGAVGEPLFHGDAVKPEI